MLRHTMVKGAQLNEADAKRVLQHLADLWTYDVSLAEVDATDKVLKEYVVSPRASRRWRRASVLIESEPIVWIFVLTRFLHANRYPLHSKTL